MRITVNQPAEPGTKYAPTAFDDQIGKTIPFSAPGQAATECTIVAATVADGGGSASLTLDVPDAFKSVLGDVGSLFSIG